MTSKFTLAVFGVGDKIFFRLKQWENALVCVYHYFRPSDYLGAHVVFRGNATRVHTYRVRSR